MEMKPENKTMRLHSAPKTRGAIPSVLLGLVFTSLFSLAFLAIAALCAYTADDPGKLLLPLSIASLVLSSLICGFASSKFAGRRGLLTGLLSGVLFAGILFCAATVFGIRHESGFLIPLALYGGVTLLSGIGGLIGNVRLAERRRVAFHA